MAHDVKKILDGWRLPFLGVTLGELSYHLKGTTIALELGFPVRGLERDFERSLLAHLEAQGVGERYELMLSTQIQPRRVQAGLKGIPGVKNIIAIASGKGGVGKSTLSANMAVALSRAGAKVGLLDADIYGPSQVMMLGASDRPESIEGKYLAPVVAHGIEVMSMGFLLESDASPVIWRGPMVTKALQQLLFETKWGQLDYLLIDLPPGTGDIQLTLCQRIPLVGSVVITTPQDIALLDAKKAIGMFKKVQVPVLGLVENMSYYHCPACGFDDPLFGTGGAEKIADEFAIETIGKIPLNRSVRTSLDEGRPSALGDDAIAQVFSDTALGMAARLSLGAKDYASRFPNIVIEKDEIA